MVLNGLRSQRRTAGGKKVSKTSAATRANARRQRQTGSHQDDFWGSNDSNDECNTSSSDSSSCSSDE